MGKKLQLEFHRCDTTIAVVKRIGIGYTGEDAESLWRFWVKDNAFVSKK